MVLNIDDFEVLKFYGYTSLIPINARINEVSSMDDNPREQIRYARLESFYNKVIEKAKEKCTNKSFNYCHFEDNKCVFCLSHIKTGHIIYIGKYDFEISILNSVLVLHITFYLIRNHIKMKSKRFLSNLNNIETCKNSLLFLAMVFLIILTYAGIIWFSDYLNNY